MDVGSLATSVVELAIGRFEPLDLLVAGFSSRKLRAVLGARRDPDRARVSGFAIIAFGVLISIFGQWGAGIFCPLVGIVVLKPSLLDRVDDGKAIERKSRAAYGMKGFTAYGRA
jgi:hypothetical protein